MSYKLQDGQNIAQVAHEVQIEGNSANTDLEQDNPTDLVATTGSSSVTDTRADGGATTATEQLPSTQLAYDKQMQENEQLKKEINTVTEDAESVVDDEAQGLIYLHRYGHSGDSSRFFDGVDKYLGSDAENSMQKARQIEQEMHKKMSELTLEQKLHYAEKLNSQLRMALYEAEEYRNAVGTFDAHGALEFFLELDNGNYNHLMRDTAEFLGVPYYG